MALKFYEKRTESVFFVTRFLESRSPRAERAVFEFVVILKSRIRKFSKRLSDLLSIFVKKVLHDALHVVERSSERFAGVVHSKKRLIAKSSGSLYIKSLNEYKNHEIDKKKTIEEEIK